LAEATQSIAASAELQKLRREANELVAILTASQKTAKRNEGQASNTIKGRRPVRT
jgi:hypothetical protein